MFDSLYQHIRSNYPLAFFISWVVVILIFGTLIISFMTNNKDLFETLGATELKNRIIAAKETTYWHFRAWRNNDVETNSTPVRNYGFLQSVNRDGTVNITIIKNNEYQNQRINLADTIINNPNALAAAVEMHKHESAEFDFYKTAQEHPYTVVWINNQPFNLQIITSGIASPDSTPPTNIVDRLFAEYYWEKLTH
jgi:hypothetical protein